MSEKSITYEQWLVMLQHSRDSTGDNGEFQEIESEDMEPLTPPARRKKTDPASGRGRGLKKRGPVRYCY
jgi:hypothetical protein